MRLETRRRIRRMQEGLKRLWESDERRICRKYRAELGRDPDLDSPRTLNEKILWLNLRHDDPRRTALSDKVAVRDWVRERIGARHLVPVLGVYDDAEDIELDSLPDRFIIKAAHGSGWNLIVRDKRDLDWSLARDTLQDWLTRNYHAHKRERQYRVIKPRLVIEELLLDERGAIPDDYKIWCLRGRTGDTFFVQVDMDRFSNHSRNYYDLDWNLLPFHKADSPPNPEGRPRPARLHEMVEIARELSDDFPLVRVDLYATGDRVYFGEMTFTPDAGMARFQPAEWDRKLGDLIGLPEGA